MSKGYQALTEGAAILELSTRGRIRVTGDDRARLLHAMTTNHVQQLKPGEGLYAFFLNAQGRIQADTYILCHEDHFILDTEPETRSLILEHLERFIIADDVTLEDITDGTFCVALEGPAAYTTAKSVGNEELPSKAFSHARWQQNTVAAISSTGEPGLRIYGTSDRKADVMASLEAAGAVQATPHDVTQVRTRHFKPRFAEDITDATLPQETQQMHALHFQKGCYLGQEIVERVRSRGHVNKHLMGFRIDSHAAEGTELISPGMKIFTGGKEAGEVTSAAVSPSGSVYGLAYVRVPYNKPGDTVGIEGRPAELYPPWSA